jgi:pimeloyl-ACP methyl ester carboxylesterase
MNRAPGSRLLLATLLATLSLLLPQVAAAAAAKLELTRKSLQSAKGVKIEAEAGRLFVPENRATARSRQIAVPFLRLKSQAAKPRAPLFYLQGGPGSRSVSERPGALDYWVPFLKVCDVVLIDQRGTNDSLLVWSWDGPPPLNYFVHEDSALRHVGVMSRRAFQVFRERGVDLNGYTTVENADDLEALRVALGMEKVSLLGFSYGTHLGTCYMRRYPQRVESSILIGTEGPAETYKFPFTMDAAFQKLAQLVARDPRIGGQVPDLVALYDRVIAKLAKQPMLVRLPAPGSRDSLDVPIGPFGLRFILRADIGDASDLPVFPRLLWSIDRGDPSVLAWFVAKRAGGALGVHGMNAAMDVASGASPARLAMIAEQSRTSRFGDVMNFPQAAMTATWGITDLGEDFRAPLISSVRTLFVSAELDCNTPPYQAEQLRWGMSNATHLIVANAGHEQTLFQNDTAAPVLTDFLAGQDVRDRKITYPAMRFVPLEGSDPMAVHPSVPK